MTLELYQIDAYTDTIFGGNPACVVPLTEWLPDALLLKIAKENAVAETAFFINKGDSIHLRWFTPDIEMDLCGHATLATAHCLQTLLQYSQPVMRFKTSSGTLTVTREADMYYLDFPSRVAEPATLSEVMTQALSITPKEVYKARDYLLVYEAQDDIAKLKINRQLFDQINLDPGGVIVTAPGTTSDFVSRFFTPQAAILEDPVTGSAHCSLIPFWVERLEKETLEAIQISDRKGYLQCTLKGDRVLIGGKARTYSVGRFWID